MKTVIFKVNYLNDEINALIEKCEHITLAIWAAECAEHVLKYFEEKYPNDNRPRSAINAVRLWVNIKMEMVEVRKFAFSAHAAAREAANERSACAAARAAGQAAATSHVATHSSHAATYAVKAVGYAKGDINLEREWQYKELQKLFEIQERNKL